MKKTTLGLALVEAVALAATVDASFISVNFTEAHANQQMLAGTSAGIGAFAVDNWNNTTGAIGTLGGLTDSDGNNTGVAISWSSSNMWGFISLPILRAAPMPQAPSIGTQLGYHPRGSQAATCQ
jgi:hypothetical protein